MRIQTIAFFFSLFAAGCAVWPDSQSGVQTKNQSFGVGGYTITKPPFAISFQQQNSSGAWVTTFNGTAIDGSSVFPPLTTWYPWAATFTPSADPTYWTDSPTFGGISSTKMRSPNMQFSTKDLEVAEDCLFTVPPDSSGTAQPLTIAQTCGDSSAISTLHTCRNGPATTASSYDCGPAGYPGNSEHADLALLTGVSFIDSSFNKITGRFTDDQRSRVRTWLQQRLSAYSIVATLDSFDGGANVVGSLPQTTAGPQNKPILIGGHFDTSSQFNAGAVDNGVGTVIMLDLAHFVSTLPSRNRPVYFVAFDREELARQGSTHFLATSTGRQQWHSVHLFDQIGGAQSNVNIEAPTTLTDCMWTMYGVANFSGAYGIPLTRVSDPTQTDSQLFVSAGIRAINVSTKTTSGSEMDCIDNHACDRACGGNCSNGTLCTALSCSQLMCTCDSYQQINFEKLASVSLLARKAMQRILAGQDTSCPN